MLTDIFSSFDPATISMYSSLPSPLFWMINFITISTFTLTFWIAPNNMTQLTSIFKEIMFTQTTRTMGHHLKGLNMLLSATFILIIFTNIMGLLPYVFSTTSHLFFTMALAIPMWFGLILSSISTSTSSFLASLLPGGAPDWLNPFLTLIETISILLRPITLSFRLAANMSAGHIALGLMGIYAATALLTNLKSFTCLILIQMFYMIFELGICLIQAYIFCLLLSLYSDDHTST
uniref:ATP synthase subunit a n=1 Tax=Neoamphitrite affinis TaxID=2716569 RepID=A0A8F9WHJ1_9ANNE|nr:ATP synthase F0 subunit 6 [Neoamphitrite affinis]